MNILLKRQLLCSSYKPLRNTASSITALSPYHDTSSRLCAVTRSVQEGSTRILSYFNRKTVKLKIFGHSFYRNINNLSKLSTMSEANRTSPQVLELKLSDYDCIGFDLDNTLCEYNLSLSVKMEYQVLAKFLVNEKGYDPCLLNPLDASSIDFLQKGLIIDAARGNILKIGENGVIFKASHGTKLMTEDEIVSSYGQGKKWDVTSEFCTNPLLACDGPLKDKMRALLDYFDMPASLAFARIIDSLDKKLGRPADMYNVWVDVREGLVNMYNREHFIDGKGDYFQEIRSNPNNFIKNCNIQVIEWLKRLKESKVTFLITGSNSDFASLTAEICLGKNWRNLFDIVVCYARKPGFFTGCRPFVELNNFKEVNVMSGNNLELGHMYSQGNWQELYQLFGRKLNKKEPRCLYFGDNLIQDVLTPSEYTKCETVAVVEELWPIVDNNETLSSKEILQSKVWGSYFFDNEKQLNTIWGSIIDKHAKVCIPSLSVLAEYSSLNKVLPNFKLMKTL